MPQTGVTATRGRRVADRRRDEQEQEQELEFALFLEPAYDRYRSGRPDRSRPSEPDRDRSRDRAERDRRERDRPERDRSPRDRPDRARAERGRPAAAVRELPHRSEPEASVDDSLARLATPAPTGGAAGRRTVVIRGQGAERYRPPASRRRPERRHERESFCPDRAALWAVLLGLMLVFVAVASAHAATL